MHWFYEKNLISHGKLMPSTGCVLQPSFLLKLIQKVQISNFNLATGTLLVIRCIISTQGKDCWLLTFMYVVVAKKNNLKKTVFFLIITLSVFYPVSTCTHCSHLSLVSFSHMASSLVSYKLGSPEFESN